MKDFNSYSGLLEIMQEANSSLNAYQNQDGELVTLVRCIGGDGVEFISKKTLQNNDRTRVNRYYADGTTEEFFIR